MLRTESDTGGSLIVLGFHPAEVLSLPAGCPVSEASCNIQTDPDRRLDIETKSTPQ